MSQLQNTSIGRLFVLSSIAVFIAISSSAWAQTVSPELRAELDRLQDAAPALSTLEARYRIDNVTTVNGRSYSFVQEGRVYVGPASVCIFKDILPGVPETQILYSRADGTCLRYFPFSYYGHRIAESSLDNQKLDFAKFWRPLLTHLAPAKELERMPAVLSAGTVEIDGNSFGTIRVQPDQSVEAERRRHAGRLERWGPPPDLTYFASRSTDRIERVEAVHYRNPASSRSDRVVATRTSAHLHGVTTVSGISIPTTLTFESRLADQQLPHRRSTLTIADIRINQQLPADSLKPIWPDDMVFLDVENQFAEAYLATSTEPASMINLADYYFGTGQRAEGLNWLNRFRDSIGSRTPTPPEAGNLARLYALAGRRADGEAIHLSAISALEQRVGANHNAADEQLLARYYTEYGYFLGRATGRGDEAAAVSYLKSKLDKFQTALAAARVCGRIAEHYTTADQFDAARNTLDDAGSLIGADATAQQWIECCRRRVDVAQQRDEHLARIRARNARIRYVEQRLSQLDTGSISNQQSERNVLRAELQRLRAEP